MPLISTLRQTGGLPLNERPLVRQHYRNVELQRWRDKLNMNFHLQPKHWPFDASLADRVVIALVQEGHDPDMFIRRAFGEVWECNRSISQEKELSDLLLHIDEKMPAARILEFAKTDAAKEIYDANEKKAVAAEVFGSPAYVRDGEVFWGQDRLDLLEDAIKQNRTAYRTFY